MKYKRAMLFLSIALKLYIKVDKGRIIKKISEIPLVILRYAALHSACLTETAHICHLANVRFLKFHAPTLRCQ